MNPTYARLKRRPIAEINVVPYIDVMLVLLVIFMVTAPMLTQGVQVDLPYGQAAPLAQDDKPPIIVTVDAKGLLYLDASQQAMSSTALSTRILAELRRDPKRSVVVRGDKQVTYGTVLSAMVLLKQAGVSKIGLMTQAYDEKE